MILEQGLHLVHLALFESYYEFLMYEWLRESTTNKGLFHCQNNWYLKTKIKEEIGYIFYNFNVTTKRISFVCSISNQQISDLLIIYFNHLNRNIIAKSVLSLIRCIKQITQSPVIYTLAFFCDLFWSSLHFKYKKYEKHHQNIQGHNFNCILRLFFKSILHFNKINREIFKKIQMITSTVSYHGESFS